MKNKIIIIIFVFLFFYACDRDMEEFGIIDDISEIERVIKESSEEEKKELLNTLTSLLNNADLSNINLSNIDLNNLDREKIEEIREAILNNEDIDIDEILPELEEYLEEYFDPDFIPPYRGYIYLRDTPEWVQPSRWFRSNGGGLAIEEMPSRLSALRNEYALYVDFAEREILPEELLLFYNEDYFIEMRILYENGKKLKTQWIFRDYNAKQRLIAVFLENEETEGFIESYNDDGQLIVEYVITEEEKKNKLDYEYINSLLVSLTENEFDEITGDYNIVYKDTFQYNRSQFLRGVERRFYKEGELSLSEEPVRFSLPSSSKRAIEDRMFSGTRYNSLPEYFGAASVSKDYRMVYKTDDQNNIILQTLYNENDEIIWTIANTWENGRIVTSEKTEGETVLTTSYEYDISGNIKSESNYRNNELERVVRIEGIIEIEELYMDNVLVLRAVWEDGRKISETRINNN